MKTEKTDRRTEKRDRPWLKDATKKAALRNKEITKDPIEKEKRVKRLLEGGVKYRAKVKEALKQMEEGYRTSNGDWYNNRKIID